MIRLVYLGRRWIGKEIESLIDDRENIVELVNEGNPIIIVDELESLKDIDIDPLEVQIVLDEGDEK